MAQNNFLSLDEIAEPAAPAAPARLLSIDEAVGSPVKQDRSFLGASAEAGGRALLAAGARLIDELNPFTLSESDAAVLFKDNPDKLKEITEKSASMALSRFANEQTRRAKEVMQEVTPTETGLLSGKPVGELEYATLDPNKAAYLSPTRVAGDVLGSLPTTLALGVAAYLTRGRSAQASARAESEALARGATAEEAKIAARSAAMKEGAETMAKVGAVGEGAAGYALQRNQAFDEAMSLPEEVFQQSPQYQALLEQGFSPEAARLRLASGTAQESGLLAGAVNAGTNLIGGRVLGRVIGEGGSLLPRTLKGLGTEAATETVQSGGEQLVGNLAMRNIQPGQSLTEGVGEAMAAGAVVGGVTGGGVAALLGSRQRTPTPQPLPEPQNLPSLEQQFGQAVGELTTTVDPYVGITNAGTVDDAIAAAGQATTVPLDQSTTMVPLEQMAAPMTLPQQQAMVDRNAELLAEADQAGTQFDRDMALAQAQTALPTPRAGAAEGFADLTPMDERQAANRLTVLRDMTAQEGGNALELAIVPHPTQAGRFAIGTQPLPSLDIESTPAPVSQQQVQNRLETAALTGQIAQRRAQDEPRQVVIDNALRNVEARGGVASPAEARIFQEAGIGQPYDRIDTNLAPPLTVDERLTQATGIPLVSTPRASMTQQTGPSDQQLLQAENQARSDSRMEQLARDRAAAQALPEIPGQPAAPAANEVISAMVVPGRERNAEQVAVINQAQNRYDPVDFSILQRAAMAPFQLNQQERLRLRELRNQSAPAAQPAAAAAPTATAVPGAQVGTATVPAARVAALATPGAQAATSAAPAAQAPGVTAQPVADMSAPTTVAPTQQVGENTDIGLLGTRVAERLGQPTAGRVITSGAKLSTQRDVAPGVTVTVNDGQTQHSATVVDPSRLGNTGRLLTQVGRIFGKRLVVFESDSLAADGFVLDDDNQSIYVNAKSQISPLAVFGHEMTHLLKRDNLQAYTALETVVQRNLAPQGMEQFTAEYGAEANLEELTSDLVGNRFQEADFWTDVFNEVAAQNPENAQGVVTRMAAALRKAVNAFLRVVRQPGFQADQYVQNLENIKAAVRQAVTVYAQSQRQSAMQLETELARQESSIDLTAGSRMGDNDSNANIGARNARFSDARGDQGERRPAGQDGQEPGVDGRDQAPSYGQAREGAVQVLGRHYSKGPRQALSGQYYGTGLKGAELERLTQSNDLRLRQRVYFYVDEGAGIRPEAGVGGYAHEVQLNNIYDPASRLIAPQRDANAFESAVIDAGFDGYKAPFGNNQAAVVLLGPKHKAVPVRAIGQVDSAAAPPPPAPTTLKQALLSRELNAVDVDRIPGARVRMGNLEVPVESRDAANAEMERIGSTTRFSRRREVPETIDGFARLQDIFPRAREGEFNTNRELKVALQQAIRAAAGQARVDLAAQTPEIEKYLVRVGVADALYAIESNANAVGWYDKTVTKALRILGKLHSEINTDPNAKFAFTWALAVTSNGLKVDKNFELAERAYKDYKRTGRMPTDIQAGKAQKAINEGLDLFNLMVDQYGIDNVRRFMDSKFRVSQIKRATGLTVTGENADTEVRGAAVLGPKIGNGFFSNLNGFFDQLTMDRWLMRTWGRWTGTLIEDRPDMVRQKRQELRALVAEMKKNAPAAAQFQKALGRKLTVGDPDELALAIQKASQDPETREKFNATVVGENLRKTGNSLAGYLDGQKEAPDNGDERNFIRKIFTEVLQEVRTRGFPSLTMSDLQALLWYPEKRLYDTAKSSGEEAEGYADDEAPDYANAAAKLARANGVTDKDIQQAIREAENDYETRERAGAAERGAGDSQAGARPESGVRGFGEREKRDFLTTGIVHRIRSDRSGDDGQPGPYARKSGGDGKGLRVLGQPSVAVFSPAPKFKNALAEIPAAAPKFFELDKRGAALFQDAIQSSKDASPFGAAVYVYPLEDYQGMRLFLTQDAKAGFALKGDDIVSVFAGPEQRGAANAIMQLAIQEGGRRLDAFNTVLPKLYGVHGFKTVARTVWNDEFAPDGWNKSTFQPFNNGEPDVVFMVYDPEYFDAPRNTDGEVIENYDDGAVKQREALGGQAAPATAAPPAPAPTITASRRRSIGGQPATTITASRRRNILGQPAPLANWTAPNDTKFDDFIYVMQDKMVDTKRVVEAIKGAVGAIDDRWNPYLQEELYHGRTAKQTKDFLGDELRPLLQEMQARGVEMAAFEEYLHNRHAEERNDQIAKVNPNMPDGGSGIDTADARTYLAALSPQQRRDFEQLAKRVDAITAGTRQLLVSSGLETQDTIDAWEQAYGSYVPLQREDLDFSTQFSGMGTGQGYSVRGSASKRATGSDRPVVDILANVAIQRERAIVRAQKTDVARAVYGLAVQNPNTDFWLAVDPEGQKDPAKAVADLVRMGLNPIDAQNIIEEPKQTFVDPRTGLVSQRVNPALRSSPNVLAVRINGEEKYVFFNANDERSQRMVSALKNLDADQLGRVMGIAAQITRYFASVNTQYNPIFGAINFLRDVQGAAFNLTTTPIADRKAQVMADTIPALRGIYGDVRAERKGQAKPTGTWATLWEEFQREGGQTGYRDQFSKSAERAEALERELKRINEGKATQFGRAIFDWLSDYNETMENAVRLAAYKAAKDKGLSIPQAASIAKNLTVNFNRKGQVATQAGALYAFFNASVQGTTRLAQTLTGPAGRKIVAGGLLLGTAQALLLAAAGYDEDEPPEFVRERNLIIPLPDGKYLTVPLPLGFNVIPNTSRVLTEFALSGWRDPSKRIGQITGSFLEMFNPIGNAGWSVQTIAPTIADPLVALTENRDYTGKAIAKKDMSSLNPTPGYTRAKETASWFSKQLAYYLNLASGGTKYKQGLISPTPDQIDYLIGQATGGVGRELLKAEQTVTSTATGEELPPYKVPLLGRFYGDTKSSAAESNRFYENITRLNEHENEIKGRQKNRENAIEYRRENPEARLVPFANQIERDVQQLRQRKRDLLERGASKESIKIVETQITNRMKRLNDRVRQLREQETAQ